jgi:iron complex transport system substrate-binding protein
MEWIKLYGLIFDCEDKAKKLFDEKETQLTEILSEENTGKKVAFFYINSSGGVVVRKPADYVPEMIRMAGGEYIFSSEDLNTNENALSTMTIQPETFYQKAQDTDILIYNSDITGSISSVNELIAKFPLIADFKAVKEKNVWCSEKNVFQQSLGAADMIRELHSIITGEADSEMTFIYRLEEK